MDSTPSVQGRSLTLVAFTAAAMVADRDDRRRGLCMQIGSAGVAWTAARQPGNRA